MFLIINHHLPVIGNGGTDEDRQQPETDGQPDGRFQYQADGASGAALYLCGKPCERDGKNP